MSELSESILRMEKLAPEITRPEFLVCQKLDLNFYFNPYLKFAIVTDQNNMVISGWDSPLYFFSFLHGFYRNKLHEDAEPVIMRIKELYIENNVEIPGSWISFNSINQFEQLDKKIEEEKIKAGHS